MDIESMERNLYAGRAWQPAVARIPMRFKRVAAAFHADVMGIKPCGSSGSEHSPESFTDLSDLVTSFLEDRDDNAVEEDGYGENDGSVSEYDTKEMLLKLLNGSSSASGSESKAVQEKIRIEAETFCRFNGNVALKEFKRRLMTHLRNRGFDAGLCKSRWEKTQKSGQLPGGEYEYVDVNVKGKRYIVEVYLGREFEIARPTARYTSLLNVFPQVFVGKANKLKEIVSLMCDAIRESTRSNEMKLAPWRKKKYMQAKWFGSYKRTINAILDEKKLGSHGGAISEAAHRSIGFEAAMPSTLSYYCKEDFPSTAGLRFGYLTAAFMENGLDTN